MKDHPVRIGLVGYGLFGLHHARAIERCSAAQLAAIAVLSAKSQAEARENHPGVEVLGDTEALLQRSDIDLIDVAVPNQLHYPVAKAALLAGKHVLLEKPMALKVAHCDELVQLAAERQRILAIGHELRLSSLWGEVKRLIERHAIGQVQHVLIELSRFPYRQGSGNWRYDQQRVGSWILEEPIHFFDLARWYLQASGEPQSVYARANARHSHLPGLHDNFSAIINFPGNAYAVVSQTLAAFGHHQTVKIAGTQGTIWAHWSAADARSERPAFGLRYGLGEEVHEISFTRPAGELVELDAEIEAVCHSVQNHTPPPCTADDGRWSTLLCLASERSVEANRVIDIAEFVKGQ